MATQDLLLKDIICKTKHTKFNDNVCKTLFFPYNTQLDDIIL